MLINRTPFRVSFLGGGSDLPWFYEKNGGAVISTSINLYMFLAVHRLFNSSSILLKYSKHEHVDFIEDLNHPIAREILSEFESKGIDISVSADVPAGSGLGSSSAFTVGLYDLIARFNGKHLTKHQIAEAACRIEINKLGEPIGKQDQYASAFGGLNLFVFNPDGTVTVRPIKIPDNQFERFNSSLYLIRTKGESRSASKILQLQRDLGSKSRDIEAVMTDMADLAIKSVERIEADVFSLPNLINKSWELKKISNPMASTREIDHMIKVAKDNGALGAKLLGAGESGFVLLVCDPEEISNVRAQLSEYKFLKVKMDLEGTRVLYEDDNEPDEF
jgi:D-glycero-alpha-D-manno-heptose-7-phosphate kinase